MSTLHTQLWLNTIEEKLKANWEILTKIAKNDNINLKYNGVNRKVIIPNAGADPVVTINSTVFSQPIDDRVDTAVEYNVDVFRTQPTLVTREDVVSVSYDKISSIVETMFNVLGEAGMYTTFSRWFNVAQPKVQYTATFGVADVLKAKEALDAQGVPFSNRILLLNAKHANELLTNMLLTNSNIAFVDNDGMGILNQPLYMFKVVQLPMVIEFASGGTTPVSYQNLGAVSNKSVSLAYHKDMVSVAKADSHIFHTPDSAANFGDIISGEAYFGGKARRTDNKGVVQIFKA